MLKPFVSDLKDIFYGVNKFASYSILEKAYTVIAIAFLIALFEVPYVYYMVLRIIVFIGLLLFLYQLWIYHYVKILGVLCLQNTSKIAVQYFIYALALIVLLVLYNPFNPISIGYKAIWTITNIGTLYFLFTLRGHLKDGSKDDNSKNNIIE